MRDREIPFPMPRHSAGLGSSPG